MTALACAAKIAYVMLDTDATEQGRRRVFLSYAQADKDTAQQIAAALRTSGLRLWFDEWELAPGDSIAHRIDEALASSDVLVVLLSPAALASRWVMQELNAALIREVRDRAIAILPALIADCELPKELADRTYIDMRTDRAAGIASLVSQLGAASALDFSRLDPKTFERLVGDLLVSIGYSVEPVLSQGHDSGIDMVAVPSGKDRSHSVVVEAKFYRQQRVSVESLRQMLGYLVQSASHRGLIVTNSRLTSVARDMLAERTKHPGPELKVMDGDELTTHLLSHPEIVRRYFAGSRRDE